MGILLGLLSSAAFGLIPFFALPLMAEGLPRDVVLFYRFLIASLALGGILVLRRERVHVKLADLAKLAGMSFMYTTSALLLFWGFDYAPSGVATTVHFLYPVLVMLIMTAFFHERFSLLTLMAVLLSVGGVALLSWPTGAASPTGALAPGEVSLFGLWLLLLSALANAVYISGIHASRITYMSGLAVAFHVMWCSAAYTLLNALYTGHFQIITQAAQWRQLLLLALVTAVLSNLTLVLAVKRIGSTLTSVLGAMEPLTAVLVGILVFHEPFSLSLAGGVGFILSAVLLVMLGPQLRSAVRGRAQGQ